MSSIDSNKVNAPVKVWGNINIAPGGSGANLQLMRGPWPITKKLEISKLIITNQSALPGMVKIWDQDLSSTTAVGRGSANDPLLVIGFGTTANSGINVVSVIVDETQLPKIVFEAGIAVTATAGTSVVFEGRRI